MSGTQTTCDSASGLSPGPDRQLLEEYLAKRSQDAFGRIVARHVSLVYGVAVRRLGDHHLAEDVTQSVFLTLARKAGALRRETALAAWLVKATIYEASELARRERRRQARERKVMAQTCRGSQTTVEPIESQPLVDEALARLGGADRRAVVLRYLYGLSNREVAAELGISENACRQRVFRGLERMRSFLAGKGISSSAGALGGMLPAMLTANPAPAHLASSVTGAAHGAAALTFWKGALLIMASTKAKLGAIAAAGLLLAGTVVTVASRMNGPRHGSPIVAVSNPSAPMSHSPQNPQAGAAGGAAGAGVGAGLEKRQITTTDGKQITVAGPRGAVPGPQVSYQYVGDVDPEVSGRTQRLEAKQLRAQIEQMLGDPGAAKEFGLTPEQLERLKKAVANHAAAQAHPASGNPDHDLIQAVRSILNVRQLAAVYARAAASSAAGARP